MEQKQPDYGSGFSFLGMLLGYAEKHGWGQIIIGMLLLPIMFLLFRVCYDPSFILEKLQQKQMEEHVIEEIERIENDAEINKLLPDILYSMNADNCWIIQYHNGKSDWMFGSMRFEYPRDGIKSIKQEFCDVHLSWFLIPQYLWENRYFAGTIDDMDKVDPCMAKLLDNFHVQYVACVVLRKGDGPLGVLGVVWNDATKIKMDKERIRARLNNYSGKLEELLIRRKELIKL